MKCFAPYLFSLVTFFVFPLQASNTASDLAGEDALKTLEKVYSRVQRIQLDNGLRILVLSEPAAPTVAIKILVGCGSEHEAQWAGGGLSHGLEHMIFKGTPTRPKEAFTRALADAGGSVNAYTTTDRTVYHVKLPARNWRIGLDALADAVFNCSLPAETWRTEQDVIVREMAMGQDSPSRCLYYAAIENLYTYHPRRLPVIGYEKRFRSMTIDDLRAYHKLHYIPENTIIAVVGAVDPRDVEKEIRTLLAGFPRTLRTPTAYPHEPSIAVSRSKVIYKDSVTKGRLLRFWHTVPATHPDAPALEVLSAWLSSGCKGRLVDQLKEKCALATEIGGYCRCYADSGYFGFFATYEPEKETELLKAIDKELQILQNEGPTEADLIRLRRRFVVSSLSTLDDMMGLAGDIIDNEFLFANPTATVSYLRQILNVTSDDVLRVARRYLKPNHFAQTILLPSTLKQKKENSPVDSLPSPTRTVIDNVPFINRVDSRIPKTTIHLRFKGGSLLENPDELGVLTLASALMTRGSNGISREQQDEQLESLGASLSAYCYADTFSVSLTALTADLPTLLPCLIGALTNPNCDQEEFEKLKARHWVNLVSQRESPNWQAWDQCRQLLYRCQRYRYEVGGTTQTVANITVSQVKRKLGEALRKGNCVLSIFGSLPSDEAEIIARRIISVLPEGEPNLAPVSTLDLMCEQTVSATQTCAQAVLVLARNSPQSGGENGDAYLLLSRILSGLSSELFKKARIDRGLAYYIYADKQTHLCEGSFSVVCGTESQHVDAVETLVNEELRRIATEGATPTELARAKEQIVSAVENIWLDNSAFASTCAQCEILGLGYDRALRLKAILDAVKLDDIKLAAQTLLSSPRIKSVVYPDQKTEKAKR